MNHVVKINKHWFKALNYGKNFEVRKNDRGYQKGDTISLIEIDCDKFDYPTGNEITFTIDYVFPLSALNINSDYVVISLRA